MSWICPECGNSNRGYLIRCVCGFEDKEWENSNNPVKTNKELESSYYPVKGIENPILPPIVIENKKFNWKEDVGSLLFVATSLSIIPTIAFWGNFFEIAIIWIVIFLIFLILRLTEKDSKTVIGNGFIRKYKRTPSKSWALISEEPYSSFCEIEFVRYTKDVWAGNVNVYLIRNKGKKFCLFIYTGSGGLKIASYDEAEHLAKSVSHELGIPINMWEDDTEGSW